MTEPLMENGYRVEFDTRRHETEKRWVATAAVVHPRTGEVLKTIETIAHHAEKEDAVRAAHVMARTYAWGLEGTGVQ